jgi:hypothetical protein
MADLSTTMQQAKRTATASVASVKETTPSALPDDIARRLQALDVEQLEQVAEALGRQVDGADKQALRRSLADYVDEWANDVAEDDREGDPEAARAAGRTEAVGFIEEEVLIVAGLP